MFISTDRPNQAIATLGGRSIVLGYRGWLYNFNLPYMQRGAAVQAALLGRTGDPMVRRFDPHYLAVAAHEGESWTLDRNLLASLPVAYHNAEWIVYRLTSAPDAVTDRKSRNPLSLAAFWMQNAPIRGPIAAFCIQNALHGGWKINGNPGGTVAVPCGVGRNLAVDGWPVAVHLWKGVSRH